MGVAVHGSRSPEIARGLSLFADVSALERRVNAGSHRLGPRFAVLSRWILWTKRWRLAKDEKGKTNEHC